MLLSAAAKPHCNLCKWRQHSFVLTKNAVRIYRIQKMVKTDKVKKVMDEWKHHKLHSGSKKGPIVTSQKQAVAIALSEKRKAQHKKKKKK